MWNQGLLLMKEWLLTPIFTFFPTWSTKGTMSPLTTTSSLTNPRWHSALCSKSSTVNASIIRIGVVLSKSQLCCNMPRNVLDSIQTSVPTRLRPLLTNFTTFDSLTLFYHKLKKFKHKYHSLFSSAKTYSSSSDKRMKKINVLKTVEHPITNLGTLSNSFFAYFYLFILWALLRAYKACVGKIWEESLVFFIERYLKFTFKNFSKGPISFVFPLSFSVSMS